MVHCYQASGFTLGERTTSKLECINAKMKSVCSRYSGLSTFFNQFFVLLSCLRNEHDHASLMALIKNVQVIRFTSEHYAKLVTPHALSFIEKQLSLLGRVKFSEHFSTGCTVESSKVACMCHPKSFTVLSGKA